MKELLFSRTRTLTPGGHPGGGITVTGRGDGRLVRVEQADQSLEVFLPTTDVNNLVEMLTENLSAWGLATHVRVTSVGRFSGSAAAVQVALLQAA